MAERSRQASQMTIGLDVGDRWTHWCRLEGTDEVGRRGRVRTEPQAVREFLARQAPARVVLEVGTHSPWMSRVIAESGHEAIVANPRRVRSIFHNHRKSDVVDAEQLARLGRFDVSLLHPIQHRGPQAQADRCLLRSRDALVRSRTALISHVRGQVKALGGRLKGCTTASFARQVAAQLPEAVADSLGIVLEMISELTDKIRQLDGLVRSRCEESYPETKLLRQIAGVGELTSLAFVVTLEDPRRFARSRDVGPFLGLVPRRDQSGDRDPALSITKTGDPFLRRLLVQAAHYILGPFGGDCDLRRFGEALKKRGGKGANKRAIIAVARKLAVLLHHLWITGEVYEPLFAARRAETRREAL